LKSKKGSLLCSSLVESGGGGGSENPGRANKKITFRDNGGPRKEGEHLSITIEGVKRKAPTRVKSWEKSLARRQDLP